MKRSLIFTFIACGASLMLGASAQAQDTPAITGTTPAATGPSGPGAWAGPGHRRGGGGILARMTSVLDLSGSQQAEIAPILEAARPQMKQMEENAQAARKTLIETVASQINPLLTPDQQTKFAAMVQRAENRTGGAGGPGGPGQFEGRKAFAGGPGSAGGPGGHGDMLQKLTSQLGLSGSQQAAIKPILEAAHTQIVTARQDKSLTAEERFAKIKDAMEAARSQINGLLTPDQQEQLASMRENFHRVRPPGAQPPAATGTTAN